jgi:hypothetical protein
VIRCGESRNQSSFSLCATGPGFQGLDGGWFSLVASPSPPGRFAGRFDETGCRKRHGSANSPPLGPSSVAKLRTASLPARPVKVWILSVPHAARYVAMLLVCVPVNRTPYGVLRTFLRIPCRELYSVVTAVMVAAGLYSVLRTYSVLRKPPVVNFQNIHRWAALLAPIQRHPNLA